MRLLHAQSAAGVLQLSLRMRPAAKCTLGELVLACLELPGVFMVLKMLECNCTLIDGSSRPCVRCSVVSCIMTHRCEVVPVPAVVFFGLGFQVHLPSGIVGRQLKVQQQTCGRFLHLQWQQSGFLRVLVGTRDVLKGLLQCDQHVTH